MTQIEEALAEIATILEELRIPYMLIGGMAVSLWGEPRATLDLDFSLWVEADAFEATLAALCQRLPALSEHPLAFAARTRVLPATSSNGVRIDLVFASLPPEKKAIARAQPKEVAGKTVMVAAVEDLVLMKLISEREKDWDDARRLLRRFRRSIDRRYLEPRLTELAEALARPGIADLFRQEMQAAGQQN